MGMTPEEKNRIHVLALRAKGWTLQRIATELGVSRQAIHQMIKRHDAAVDRRNGKA